MSEKQSSSFDEKFKGFFVKIGRWFKSLFVSVDGKEPGFVSLYKKPTTKSILSSVLCIVAGILVGFVFMIIMALSNPQISLGNAFQGLGIMIAGPFASGAGYISASFGTMIFYSGPLIMTGLSVAIAFKTGLFNIGAPGQFLMGTMGSLLVALNINAPNPFVGFLVWLLAMIVGMIMGAIWGCLPGLFKALFNVNEVIVCIMTNWIAANMVSWVFSAESLSHLINKGTGKAGFLVTTATSGTGTPTLGLDKLFPDSYIDSSIFIAILFAVAIYFIINKTTFGYELKACGSNKHSAKYAGMNEKRNIILSMAIAGALASAGGALYYLNPNIEFKFNAAYSSLPSYGFNGIPVALLASSNPIGVIFAGIFMRYLSKGGENLVSANYNQYIADTVVALIIYFAGFSRLFLQLLNLKRDKSKKQPAATDATVAESAPQAEVFATTPDSQIETDETPEAATATESEVSD